MDILGSLKYENGVLCFYKRKYKNYNENTKLYITLENKTLDIKVENAEMIDKEGLTFFSVDKSYFRGNGYYVATLLENDVEVEKYGFYYGDTITVEFEEVTRCDSKGVERYYFRFLSKAVSIPGNRIYIIVNDNQAFKFYIDKLEVNVDKYYTIKKPEKYELKVDSLKLDNDVEIYDENNVRYGIVINNVKKVSPNG